MTTRLLSLAALAIVAAGCGSSSTPTMAYGPTAPSGSNVSIVAGSRSLTTTAYNPNPITISRGMSVTWVNNDNISHTSTSDTGMWSSGNIAPGGQFSATFAASGTFPYHCAIHPNMVGTVVVQ